MANAEGPHDRIVMSSRVRLARNLKGRLLSRLGQEAGARQDLEMIRPAVEALAADERMRFLSRWTI